MPQGLVLFDAERRLLMSNERFCAIYGLPADMMKPGLTTAELVQHIAARGFMPDDTAVEEFESLAAERSRQLVVSADGRTIALFRIAVPGGGWIATHEDITEQRHADRQLAENASALRRANERFDVAINNMPQGVCLFDAQQRVVVANTRYAELYHLDPVQVKSGTTLTQILEARRSRGTNFAVAPDTYVSVNVTKTQETQELADGRIVSISRRLLSDGGWLTSHEDITERAQSERRIAYMAQHDMLTGLANRAQFAEKLDEVSKRHNRHGTGFAVFMLDLDRFKAVNDTLGHAAGDLLLKQVATRLKGSLRETDVLARLGGDEFAIIQEGEAEQRQAALTVARRIVDVMSKPFDLDGRSASIGTSIGIAFAPEHGDDPGELMKRADMALYAAKGAGRNDYRVFGSDMVRNAEAPPLVPEPTSTARKPRRKKAVAS
jgi:diguanylate cyclase (GGDEF)-like protein